MDVHFLAFFFILIWFSVAGAVAPDGCPAPQGITETSMTPALIGAWLKTVGTSVKTPHQLVCCLPKKFKSQYIVGHSSLAGQNGTITSPRIIAFDIQRDKANIETKQMLALSVSGGHHSGLQQKDSVEFMYLNPRTSELEYFDLEFEKNKSAKLSKPNPELCMNCHGQDGKTLPGGPRPIFDPFAEWNRFVGGRAGFCSQSEEKYFRKIEGMAVDSINKNPNFDCLDKSVLEAKAPDTSPDFLFSKQFGNLSVLDSALKGANRKRVLRLMKSYSSFKKDRLSLIGLTACGGSLKDWLPPETVDSMRNLVLSDRSVRNVSAEKEVASKVELLKADEKKYETLTAQQLALNAIDGDKPGLIPAVSETQCFGKTKPFLNRERLLSTAPITDPDDLALLMRYQKRNLLNGIEADSVTRLLFESAGEDVSLWEMSPTGSHAMTPLLSQIPELQEMGIEQDSKLKDELKRFFDFKPADVRVMPFRGGGGGFAGLTSNNEGLFLRENSCEKFREHVQKSFAAPVAPSGATKKTIK